MRFPILDRFLSRLHTGRSQAIAQDADDLRKIFGDATFQSATMMALREDSGLVSTSRPGHWHLVQQELANRLAGLGSPYRWT